MEHDANRTVEQRLTFVTLAVADTARSRHFYVEGLGWEPDLEVPGEVIFFQVGHGVLLSLWDRDAFTEEVGQPGAGLAPITLAHNVADPDTVDAVLAAARGAGSPSVADGIRREWGGYSGYFADPDGYRWEVAHNPGDIGSRILAEGTQWYRRWKTRAERSRTDPP